VVCRVGCFPVGGAGRRAGVQLESSIPTPLFFKNPKAYQKTRFLVLLLLLLLLLF